MRVMLVDVSVWREHCCSTVLVYCMFVILQTVFVDSSLMLCDCPGLVFPSFVTTKADLVVNGILPIDQMRDCLSPSALVSFYHMISLVSIVILI